LKNGGWFGDIVPNSFLRFDAFLLGAIGAVYENSLKKLPSEILIFAIVIFIFLVTSYPKINDSKLPMAWQLTVISISFLCVVILSLQEGWFKKFLTQESFVYLGKISYGLYLFHQFSFTFLRETGVSAMLNWPQYFVLGLILTAAMASLSYFTLERRLFRFKDRFTVIPSRQ
jgi:peptidoglycan/LPS O-acetylase OafA/YrhL